MPTAKSRTTWRPRFEVHEWFFGLASEWAECRRTEPSPSKATSALVRLHAASIREDPQRAIFWLMLAYYQCRDGCLQPLVKRRALAVIRRGPEVVFWLDGSPSTPARRRKDYDTLRKFIGSTSVLGLK
jgi:hypothetical protein